MNDFTHPMGPKNNPRKIPFQFAGSYDPPDDDFAGMNTSQMYIPNRTITDKDPLQQYYNAQHHNDPAYFNPG